MSDESEGTRELYLCEYCENDEVEEDQMYIICSYSANMCNECHERFEWKKQQKAAADARWKQRYG